MQVLGRNWLVSLVVGVQLLLIHSLKQYNFVINRINSKRSINICQQRGSSAISRLQMAAEVAEFGEDVDDKIEGTTKAPRKTHGYEGDFKVGDVVKVKKSIKLWNVKQYSKTGFDCNGFVGTVQTLLLYGRKYGTLCSAITPIKVEFLPTGEGIPEGMFDKKFNAHFCAEELDLIKAADPQ